MRERPSRTVRRRMAEAVPQLPWLAPSAASLAALARHPPPRPGPLLRDDPGAVLLLLRQSRPPRDLPALSFFPRHARRPAVCDEALRLLGSTRRRRRRLEPAGRSPGLSGRLTLCRAGRASWPERSAACDPEEAWVCGLLAPLGWLAVCAADAATVAACLAEPDFAATRSAAAAPLGPRSGGARPPAGPALAPAALAGGRRRLPGPAAENWPQRCGADPALFRVVQLAVGLAQRHGHRAATWPVGTAQRSSGRPRPCQPMRWRRSSTRPRPGDRCATDGSLAVA